MFAYLVNQEHLEFFRAHKEYQLLSGDAAIHGLVGYMTERNMNKTCIADVISEFTSYLQKFDSDRFDTAVRLHVFWLQSFKDYLNYSPAHVQFSKVAAEVLVVPASEAAFERVFSSLSKITSFEKSSTKSKTVNIRLAVKYDSLFSHAPSNMGATRRRSKKISKT